MAREFPQWTSPRIFPAIDLRGGRSVRLVRGERGAEISYDEDPVALAKRWEEAGAECLHVIDLGGAFGEEHSRGILLEITAAVGVPVEAGGGIRDEETLEMLLDGGVARVILGTRAFRDPDFLAAAVLHHGPGRIMVSMDCEGDRIKVAGWEEESPLGLEEGLALAEGAGVTSLLVTATDRDGTLSGARIDLIRRVLDGSEARVVAAGGIGSIEHVRAVLGLAHPRLEGVVIGRALHDGAVRLEDALRLTNRERET
ncbi:MAG TPA: 1-(5-phosphoribosyl)-5-[(5-phosphoribosylamino)methylideneamino] imidazole-4-carboxamide isomerase [Planctomycetota bacterium]|nr:1-(5-phosphoribosyl)-5-[(5-phosphoribosylamino)methylideneamino] imidazole-4-carboxamide isomerase [Planctomycetota bacterium]